STSVVPEPTSDGPHAFRASAEVFACNWPEVQVGTPLTFTSTFLSPSSLNSLIAGGCLPSSVLSFDQRKKVIGVTLFFGSACGEKPPSYSTSRLPTITFCGLATTLPTTASPASTTTAIAPAR